MLIRRSFGGLIAAATLACSDAAPASDAAASAAPAAPAASSPVQVSSAGAAATSGDVAADSMVVYKSPTCGCCGNWIDHARQAGFAVTARDMDDMNEVKAAYGVPGALQSCHTTQVGKYVVEGHVPADVVQRMLKEQPDIVGIAAPGMPVGSPGMEVPGRPAEPYEIVAWDRTGKTTVYERR